MEYCPKCQQVCERPHMTKSYWFAWIALLYLMKLLFSLMKTSLHPFAGILVLLATELSYKPDFFIMRMYLCQKQSKCTVHQKQYAGP